MPKTSLDLQSVIDGYADLGFALFPLKGKVPVYGCKWREVPHDPLPEAALIAPHGNFGVALRAEHLVIDVDPRNGGDQTLQRLLDGGYVTAEQLESFTVLTGSGGRHIYLRKPAEFKIRKTVRGFKGIDFLSEGCYVVGMGSIHPETGQPYIGEFTPIREANSELLTLIEKKYEVATTEGNDGYTTDPQTTARYIEYLKNAPAAVEGESGDRTTFTVAAMGHDYGLSPDTVHQLLCDHYNHKCVPQWGIGELRVKVENAFKYAESALGNKAPAAQFPKENNLVEVKRDLFHRDQYGGLKNDMHNAALFFGNNQPLGDLLGFDQFSLQIVFLKPAPWHTAGDKGLIWDDGEALRCKYWLSAKFKFEPKTTILHEAAYVAAIHRSFHPVKEYLESLEWDGHRRVYNWLHNLLGAEDNDYTRAISVKVLAAAISRIYEPGCKFDYILVLEGPQGVGKSTSFEILAGKKWFCDSTMDVTNKDAIQYMFGKWIIELPEMETHRKTETQAMKSFLARHTDRARMPYARTTTDYPRQSIFIGTINPEKDADVGWLKDTTGNRRYWPVQVNVEHPIRLDDLRKVRDQLWAEALCIYRAGMTVYFDDEKLQKLATQEQKKRLGLDPWFDTVSRWVDADHMLGRTVLTGQEIFTECLGGRSTSYTRREMLRISTIMEDLGWDKGTHYSPDKKETIRGYRRPTIE